MCLRLSAVNTMLICFKLNLLIIDNKKVKINSHLKHKFIFFYIIFYKKVLIVLFLFDKIHSH